MTEEDYVEAVVAEIIGGPCDELIFVVGLDKSSVPDFSKQDLEKRSFFYT